MKLLAKQITALKHLEDHSEGCVNEVLYGGAAGGGKSFLGCFWIIKCALRYPGTRWLLGRRELKNLKKTTYRSFLDVCKLQGIKKDVHFKVNNQDNIIYFLNGSEIYLQDLKQYPGDLDFDSLGSMEITGAFLDEVNQMVYKAWEIVMSRIRYKLDEYNLKPKILGTCNPAKNWVYTYFYIPHKKGELKKDKVFIQSLVDENKFISRHYIANLDKMSTVSKERLRKGNWDFNGNIDCIFKPEDILDIFTNIVKIVKDRYISVDVAGAGEDRAVIMFWRGTRVEEIHIASKCNQRELRDQINSIKKTHSVKNSNIVIDADGMGIGIAQLSFPGCFVFHNAASPIYKDKSEAAAKFANLKAQCYHRMADFAGDGNIRVQTEKIVKFGYGDFQMDGMKVQEYLMQELDYARRKDTDKDTKTRMIGKDEIKEEIGRSPDFSDCAMMRFVFEVKQKTNNIWEAYKK